MSDITLFIALYFMRYLRNVLYTIIYFSKELNHNSYNSEIKVKLCEISCK